MNRQELKEIIEFIKETDKLKSVHRKTYLSQENRFEDSTQHSWHLALLVILIKDHLSSDLDYTKMLEMAIIHDLVEIYAGDTYTFDEEANKSKVQREKEAAKKLFAKLPEKLQFQFDELNTEYVSRNSSEAQHISALNKLIPKIQNKITNYRAWRENNLSREKLDDSFTKYCEFNEEIKLLSEVMKEDIKDYQN